MATREDIEGEIRKLNDKIGKLETERLSAKTDEMKISLGAEITAMTGLLNTKEQRLLQLEQQGKVLQVFPLMLLPNLLDVILCPISFDIFSSLIQVRRLLKVRSDGDSLDVDIFVDVHYFAFVFYI